MRNMATATRRRFAPLRTLVDEITEAGSRNRQLRAMLDEVADIPWWNPVWSAVVGVSALFETYGPDVAASELHALYLSADGGPRIDTFMGRKIKNRLESPAARIARAVVLARAAVDTLDDLDGTLPRQPLHCCVGWKRGWLRRHAVSDPKQIAFLTANGGYVAKVTAGDELALARALAAGTLPHLLRNSSAPTPVAAAVSLVNAPLDRARHIHRQVWSDNGGPWLGVGSAEPYEITTTCHLVTDGYGHWLVTDQLFRRTDELAELERAIRGDLEARFAESGGGPAPGVAGNDEVPYEWRFTWPVGVAETILEGHVSFAQAAYGFGRAVARLYQSDEERIQARHTPTFQVPIAPLPPDGSGERRRQRVVPGLMAVRQSGGRFEPFDAFRARLPALLEREMRGGGVLTRLMQAAARVPAPDRVRRHYLAAPARPGRLSSFTEVVAGRGVLSCMRLGRHEQPKEPFYAVAGPPLQISPHDRRGAAVLTLMHHDGFVTVTTTGTGLAATHGGAARILDVWVEEIERLRLKSQRGGRPPEAP